MQLLWLTLTLTLGTLTCVSKASLTCRVSEQWYGGYKIDFTLTADNTLSSWDFQLSMNGRVDSVESEWVANNARVSDNTFRLWNLGTNGDVNGGDSISSAIVVQCASICADGQQFSVSLTGGGSSCNTGTGSAAVESSGDTSGTGSDASSGTNTGPTGISTSSKNYKDALKRAIWFYYGQRSGELTNTFQPMTWVVSSATSDRPVGGWYDAGDYVKFNLPMAWSAVTQLWSLRQFQAGYQAAGLYSRAKDSVRWALDYLLRCWNNDSKELVVQVGDGDADHATWERPEKMASYRPDFKVTTSKPGSDVAGITAAALAAGSIVFKSSNPTYSSKLLSAAKQVYSFARTYTGKYSDSVPEAAAFYSSSGYKDELCVASVWLKRATGDNSYLDNAKNHYYDPYTSWAFSWDDNKLACQILLYEETKASQYKTAVSKFFQDWVGGFNPSYTPCGLVYRDKWGPLRYAANAAFAALVAAADGIESVNSKNLRQFAVEQINYMLGDNAMSQGGKCYSYVIGHGDVYPTQPHHRAASCPPDKWKACYHDNSQPSPNVLQGALVGGPDTADSYKDQRTDYAQSEVACDYNAGLQGALAGIVQLQENKNLPVTNNKCKC